MVTIILFYPNYNVMKHCINNRGCYSNAIFSLSDVNVFAIAHFWLAVHGKPVLFWKGISG